MDPGEKWIDPNVPQKAATEQSPMPATDLFQTESEPGEWVLDLDFHVPQSLALRGSQSRSSRHLHPLDYLERQKKRENEKSKAKEKSICRR